MSLMKEIEAAGYVDKDGMVTPWPCSKEVVNGSGNGLMYTSEAILIMHEASQLTQGAMIAWSKLIRACEMGKPGVLKRGPHHGDTDTSFDDYFLVAAASKIADPQIAIDMLNHGLSHHGVFSNEPLNWSRLKKQYLFRNPQFKAHLYFATGQKPSLWLRACWIAGVLANILSKDVDGAVKTWAMVLTARGVSADCDAVIKLWLRAMIKRENLLARTIDPNHPMAKAFQLKAVNLLEIK